METPSQLPNDTFVLTLPMSERGFWILVLLASTLVSGLFQNVTTN